MQTPAEMFLDMLDQRGILPPADVENLRDQVHRAEAPIHPVMIARRLVETGNLNAYYAKTLLTELAEAVSAQRSRNASDGTAERDQPVGGKKPAVDEQDPLQQLGIGSLEDVKLMSGTELQAKMLPAAEQGWWESWFSRRKPLKLERPGYERFLLPACVGLAVCVILLLILIMTAII